VSRRIWVDTSVLALAAGGEHAEREPCRRLVQAASAGSLELHASVEMVQEFLFHRLRRAPRSIAVAQARRVGAMCVLHPFDEVVLARALDLVMNSVLGGRDAVLVATAPSFGFDDIVSADRDFDATPGLRRIAPADVPTA
jgi:uncharacterized protein